MSFRDVVASDKIVDWRLLLDKSSVFKRGGYEDIFDGSVRRLCERFNDVKYGTRQQSIGGRVSKRLWDRFKLFKRLTVDVEEEEEEEAEDFVFDPGGWSSSVVCAIWFCHKHKRFTGLEDVGDEREFW